MKARLVLPIGRILMMFFGFFFGVGFLLFGLFIFVDGFRQRALEERGVVVPGEVVKAEKTVRQIRERSGGRTRISVEENLVVAFEFTTQQGQSFRGTERFTYEEPPPYRAGDDIRVIYDSARPNVFAIYHDNPASGAQIWGLGAGLMALGLILLLPIYFGFRKQHGSVTEQLFEQQIAFAEIQLGHDDPRLAPTLESYAKFLHGKKRHLEAEAVEARLRRLRALGNKS